jgi:hypothetical protein
MWQALLGPVMEMGKSWIKGKAEEQKVKQEVKLEKLKTDADWEARMADATKGSWKDEWFTVVLSAPLIAIAWAVATDDTSIIDRVNQGFEALQNLPDFYQQLLIIAVLASFGIKAGSQIFKK